MGSVLKGGGGGRIRKESTVEARDHIGGIPSCNSGSDTVSGEERDHVANISG